MIGTVPGYDRGVNWHRIGALVLKALHALFRFLGLRARTVKYYERTAWRKGARRSSWKNVQFA